MAFPFLLTVGTGCVTARLTVMSLFQVLCQLCSHCKLSAPVLEWKWAEITCFIPASERDWRVHMRPKEPIFMGKRSLFQNKRSKRDRSEGTLAHIFPVLSWICLTLWLFFHHIFFFFRTVGRNSPTLVISRDTCVFTLERSLSAVGIATRLSLTLQPVKLMRKLTGDLRGFNLAHCFFFF